MLLSHMKKFCFVFLFCFLAIFYSCEKDVGISASPSPKPASAPDTIFYSDITDTTFYSVAYVWPSPYPADSSCSFQLDVDGDLIPDFRLFSNNSGASITSGGSYACGGNSFGASDGLATLTTPGPVLQISVLSIGSYVGASLYYDSLSCVKASFAYIMWQCGSDNTDKYCGFKIYRGTNYYYGWILFSNAATQMTIKAWAINKTAGNSILTGQIF